MFPISWNEFLRSTLHAPRVELFLVTGRFHPKEKRHKRSPRRGGGNKKIVFDLWILIYSVGKINCAKNLTPLPVLFKNFDACAEQLFFKNICQLLLLTFFWKIWNQGKLENKIKKIDFTSGNLFLQKFVYLCFVQFDCLQFHYFLSALLLNIKLNSWCWEHETQLKTGICT